MKTTILETFSDFISYTEPYKNQFYFRGQAHSGWDIIPSLFRSTCSLTLEAEFELVRKEMEASNLNALSALFKLQHYGTPTRICDLTISPMSALFFAVNDASQEDKDGVVYVFNKGNSIPSTSESVELISQVYIQDDLPTFLSGLSGKGLIDSLTTNCIIQYDYKFSYTNKRAILQGGTALLFGFGYQRGQLLKQNNPLVDDWIIDKIIIPAEHKKETRELLSKLGYSEDILYGRFENTNNSVKCSLVEVEHSIQEKSDFIKFIAKYRISSLYYDRDELIANIADLYDALFRKLGLSARIWLYIYYDNEDVKRSNWICRTEWHKDNPYLIKWTRDYYQTRLSGINEQSSEKEVIVNYYHLLRAIEPLYLDILQTTINNKSLKNAIAIIRKHKSQVDQIAKAANSIPFCNAATDDVAEQALSFINDVSWLFGDMIIFHNREDENKQTSWYLLNTLYLTKCEESRKKLKYFYEFAESRYSLAFNSH